MHQLRITNERVDGNPAPITVHVMDRDFTLVRETKIPTGETVTILIPTGGNAIIDEVIK